MKKIFIPIFLLTYLFPDGISGISYFNYSEDGGFGMARTYFTYKNKVSDKLSFTFQTDIGQLSNDSNDGVEDDRWIAYLKKAQADLNIADGFKISMGLIGMNMFNVQEKTWGNRFVAKSALDGAGWGVASADMGVGVEFLLNLDQSELNKMIISLLLTNGEGYKHSNVDDNQKLSIQVLYGEKRLDKNSGYNLGMVYSSVDDAENNTEKVIGFFGGGSKSGLTAGIEYYVKSDESIIVNPLDNGTDSSYKSFSLNYDANESISVFIRKDFNDPNEDVSNDETEVLMAGLIYNPTKGLSICPNILQQDSEDTFKLNFEFKF